MSTSRSDRGPKMATATIQFEAIQDRMDHEAWRVEGIDYTNDGIGYIALFMGPNAQERAKEYASFKNR
jgi:hypothetical protein